MLSGRIRGPGRLKPCRGTRKFPTFWPARFAAGCRCRKSADRNRAGRSTQMSNVVVFCGTRLAAVNLTTTGRNVVAEEQHGDRQNDGEFADRGGVEKFDRKHWGNHDN
jgi:hypothetical protein